MLDISPFPYKVDDDLELEPFSQEHTARLFEIVRRDRAYLRQWQNWPDRIRTVHDMRNMVGDSRRKTKRNHGIDLVLCHRGQVAGKIGLTYIDWRRRHSEIGYWIAFDFQGLGLMTRACRAVVDYALLYLNLRSVQIRCAEANVRSAAIPQRLGFLFNGVSKHTIWIHNEAHRECTYTMEQHEWRARRIEKDMIYHITTKAEWQAAQKAGLLSHPSLESEGFIHFSGKDQVAKVANAVFTGRDDLVILCVDPTLLTAPLKYEPPSTSVPDGKMHYAEGELFPHLYGMLPINAVDRVVEFPPNHDGTFSLPEGMEQD